MFTGPPIITTHPTSQWAVAGTNITLTCEGTGAGSVMYQWESSNIKEEKWMEISDASNTRLDLNNLERSQQYRCVASNEAGGARSKPAIITVLSEFKTCTMYSNG